MPMEPFFMRFLEVATQETRTIMTFGQKALPDDQYVLTEYYCNEPDCDCRRVIIHIGAGEDWDKPLASINTAGKRSIFIENG